MSRGDGKPVGAPGGVRPGIATMLWASLKSLSRQRRSVRGKLVAMVLLTTTTVLLISGIAIVVHDLVVYRASWASDMATEASILALSTAPAMAFDDREVAARNLAALQARPSVLAAALYTPNGRLYTQFVRQDQAPPPLQAPAMTDGIRVSGERVEIAQPITHNGELLGTIYLRARYDVLGRIGAYLGIFAFITALSLFMALVTSVAPQRAITEPLESIADVARQIVDRRDHGLRVVRTTDDEFGIVVQALNNMLDEIQVRTQALESSKEALLEADRRKDEFLATLAHELRNPLAPIRHATRLLDTDVTSEPQRRWAREVIARQVQHMALLLDDLLDVSRITRGRLELRHETVTLADLVHSAVETSRPLIDGKRHELLLDLPAEVVGLHVDPLRISQALSNLLTNAAKYTDAGGRIDLAVRVEPEGLRIEVRDNGIGLTESALSRIFGMFSQVESALGRSQGGLGIGLALVQGLVAMHGGTVEATSPGLGHGSMFTVRLPASAIVQPGAGGIVLETRVESTPRIAWRILVADDNRDAVDSLALLLRLTGYEVVIAHTGSAALELALATQPQILILDIGMPLMSGYEVAQRIRQERWGRSALLIALTGWGHQDDVDRACSAGFDRHFRKPVDVDELGALLSAFDPGRAEGERAAASSMP